MCFSNVNESNLKMKCINKVILAVGKLRQGAKRLIWHLNPPFGKEKNR